MPRNARIVVPECLHHVTQRGNQRRQMFFGEDDYRLYLSLLGEFFGRYGVRIYEYCLMPNHVHLLPVPALADALSRALGLIDQHYGPFLNFRDGLSGHRWQNRFFSCPLDETYFLRVLRYIERNPARAHLAAHPWEYPWCSALAHCTGEDPTDLLDLTDWTATWPGDSWREYVALPDVPGEAETFRLATTIGRPLGNDAFIDHLEEVSGRRLRPYPVGRPQKKAEGRENMETKGKRAP